MTDFKHFPLNNFTYCLTLFPKCLSSFPHSTCSLLVFHPYLALDGIYHLFLSYSQTTQLLESRGTRECASRPRHRCCSQNWYLPAGDRNHHDRSRWQAQRNQWLPYSSECQWQLYCKGYLRVSVWRRFLEGLRR
ncbi:hypothetical protein JB92DRAFT_2773344 [Gautieria morchelliformis]|nr:hypothetical protein JB92DRAFT_2773344 [Gautieria morchelliformis]